MLIRTPIDYVRRLPGSTALSRAVDMSAKKRQQMADLAQQVSTIEAEVERSLATSWSEEEINTAKREQRDADEAEDIARDGGQMSPARTAAIRAMDEAAQCVALATLAVREICR